MLALSEAPTLWLRELRNAQWCPQESAFRIQRPPLREYILARRVRLLGIVTHIDADSCIVTLDDSTAVAIIELDSAARELCDAQLLGLPLEVLAEMSQDASGAGVLIRSRLALIQYDPVYELLRWRSLREQRDPATEAAMAQLPLKLPLQSCQLQQPPWPPQPEEPRMQKQPDAVPTQEQVPPPAAPDLGGAVLALLEGRLAVGADRAELLTCLREVMRETGSREALTPTALDAALEELKENFAIYSNSDTGSLGSERFFML